MMKDGIVAPLRQKQKRALKWWIHDFGLNQRCTLVLWGISLIG